MKTSRIIFISFFSIIGLFLAGFMIMGFIYNDRSKNYPTFKEEAITLESYSHIVVHNDCNVIIRTDGINQLSYHSNPDSVQIKPEFRINNDTLFILSTRTNLLRHIQLKVNNLVSISGKHCDVTFIEFHQKSLFIDVLNSKVTFNAVSIDEIEISLSESSRFDGWDLTAQKVTLNTRNSYFEPNFKTKLKVLEGNITDGSNVRLPQASYYNLNVDESSKTRMY